MRWTTIAFCVASLIAPAFLFAAEPPAMPEPTKEHQWLQQFVGEWEGESEAMVEPGKPPMKAKGTETARAIGGFWVVSEGKAEMMGMPFTFVMILGYDADKKKYIGTWVDNMSSHQWKYEGTVDEAGKKLTFETEGPSPSAPGKTVKWREVMELKSKDHRVSSTSILGDDGKWITIVTGESRRKK